jgi:hypothetical protein
MKSFTIVEARRYCSQPGFGVEISKDNALFYSQSKLPSLVIKAPVEVRQIIDFIITLVRTAKNCSFQGGFVWFTRYDVGVMDSACLGWKIIESIRRANGDTRTLDIAPAQRFRENEETELKVFLFQAITFGWSGYFLPSGFDCLIDFRTSERWFFHSKEQNHLTSLFDALKPWSPAYEDPDASYESARELFRQAEQQMAEGKPTEAIEYYRSALVADTDFFDAARGLVKALRLTGRDDEAAVVEKILAEVD